MRREYVAGQRTYEPYRMTEADRILLRRVLPLVPSPAEMRELPPIVEVYRAPIYTHREWCRWLASRGSLAETHRGCLKSDFCVAKRVRDRYEPGDWRGRK